jgi:hypothetical protein
MRDAARARNFQEFKRYVDVEDYIKNHILFMFLDTENEARGMLHSNAHNDPRQQRMITIINDLDGAFFNAGRRYTTLSPGRILSGGGGTTVYKWRNNRASRRGPGGWFGDFIGDFNRTNHTVGNLEFRTMVRDQVLQQIGPYGGDLRGRPGAPLSVDNVNRLITENFNLLNNTHAYRVDAAFMGWTSNAYQQWHDRHRLVLQQTEYRVRFNLQSWARYGMVHTHDPVAIVEVGSGIELINPNPNTSVYFTTNGSDPMGPNGTWPSTHATRYVPGTIIPAGTTVNVRAFSAHNWGPRSANG